MPSEFSYVVWGAKTPITTNKLFQMSENDQYAYELATSASQGIIGWRESTADHNVTASYTTINGFTLTKTIPSDRLLKVHFHCSTLQGSTTGNCRIQVRITVDGTMFASREADVEKNYKRSLDDVEAIIGVAGGSHTFVAETRYQVGGVGTPSVRADANQPMQFWIEDVGAFVSKDT